MMSTLFSIWNVIEKLYVDIEKVEEYVELWSSVELLGKWLVRWKMWGFNGLIEKIITINL